MAEGFVSKVCVCGVADDDGVDGGFCSLDEVDGDVCGGY